jgi:uncharacterized membrane protein
VSRAPTQKSPPRPKQGLTGKQGLPAKSGAPRKSGSENPRPRAKPTSERKSGSENPRPRAKPTSERAIGSGVASRPPRWRQRTLLGVSLLGLCVAIYLTVVHYGPKSGLVCPLHSGLVNCQKVTTSPQSVIFGLPVALYGVIFFIAMIALNLPKAWDSPNLRLAQLRVAGVIVAMGFVLYLIATELLVIHAICIWCTSIHFLTFVMFILVLTGWQDTGAARAALTEA